MLLPYVFISYSHSDVDFATALAARLQRAGVPHFQDLESIDWGDDIPDRVHQALERATHLVVLISPGSAKSQWVAYEMGYARGRRVVLVPYLLHPAMELPGFISSKRCLKNSIEEKRFILNLRRSLPKGVSKAAKSWLVSTIGDREARVISGMKMLLSPNPQVRRDGIDVLVNAGAGAQLVTALGHGKSEVRQAAAEGCAQLRHGPAIPYLVAGMRRLGNRGYTPVIPGAENQLKLFGPAAIAALLADPPRQTEKYWRWRDVVAGLIDDTTAPDILAAAGKTHEDWLIEAILQSGTASISSVDLLPLIERYARSTNGISVYRIASIFESIAKSTNWKSSQLSVALKSIAQEAIGRIDRKGDWNVDSAVTILTLSLGMRVFTDSEAQALVNETKNEVLQQRFNRALKRSASLAENLKHANNTA